jgi:cytosine/adenosine deaminase-related metal-dependent hydrolase
MREDARAVEARGKFLLPGLSDMHVHTFDDIRHRIADRDVCALAAALQLA